MKLHIFILNLFILCNFLFSDQMLVVGEVFTESWWPYCPDARAGIRDLENAQPNFIPLIWQGDTQYASPGYINRFNMYNGSGLPLAQFGGYLSVSGGGGDMYNTYLTRYNIINNLDSPLSISLSSDIIGDQINMQVDVDITGEIDHINNKVVFILSSYQDDDYFCSVISYDYVPFNSNTENYQSSVTIDPSWDINQIKFIALVQSFSDDEILQASSMSVPLNNLLIMDTQIGVIHDADGGDGDGVPNPGESVEISVIIINESMELNTLNEEIIISTSSGLKGVSWML